MLQNIQCLVSQKQKTKIDFLAECAQSESVDIIALTETWLRDAIDNKEINMPGYSIFRCDRMCKLNPNFPHGGALCYIKDNLVVDNLNKFSNGKCEVLALTIPMLSLSLFILYRPPKTSPDIFQEAIDFCQGIINDLPNDQLLAIMGDFNFPKEVITWTQSEYGGMVGHVHGINSDDTKSANVMINFMNDIASVQHVMSPTRGANTLDLFFTNDNQLVDSVEILRNKTVSDHDSIYITTNLVKSNINCNSCPSTNNTPFDNFNYQKADWERVRSALRQSDLEEIVKSAKTLDQALELLINEFIVSLKKAEVPEKKLPPKNKIPRDRRRLFSCRSKLLRQLKKTTSEFKAEKIRLSVDRVNQRLKCSLDKQRLDEEEKALTLIKENPKHFFTFAKRRSKIRPKIGPLERSDGTMTNTDSEVANTLNEQYRLAFSSPDTRNRVTDPDDLFKESDNDSLVVRDVHFTVDCVKEVLKSFKAGSAPGPDGIPSTLIKECSHEIAPSLLYIFQKSLEQGIVPGSFKKAHITPIYKGGNQKEPKNFRPVALTSHLAKALEKLVLKELVKFLQLTGQMNPEQHGFRSGRSTTSQLIQHMENIVERLEEGDAVDVIYLDFAKAFDKVDHGILLRTLQKLGIRGPLGKWIYNFITGRSQVVKVNGEESDPTPVISGVPQGTVLAGTLFICMMKSIDEKVTHSKVSSYADDTKVLHKIKGRTDEQDLQKDLVKIYNWAAEKNMTFNGDKFQVLRYGCTKDSNSPEYKAPNGDSIPVHENVKDLGIWMSSKGTFDHHINDVVQRASNMSGWILRTFKSRCTTLMLTLFKTMVLSKLDYCSPVYHPASSVSLTTKIERVQRAFTRKIEGMNGVDYWLRLKLLRLYSVERRRERFIIIYLFKMLHGLVPNIGMTFTENDRTGIHFYQPVTKKMMTGCFKNMKTQCFSYTAARIYNSLPRHLKQKQGLEDNYNRGKVVEDFKKELDCFLTELPDQPTTAGLTRAAETNSIVDQINYIEN